MKIAFVSLFFSLASFGYTQQELYCKTQDGLYSILVINLGPRLLAMIHEMQHKELMGSWDVEPTDIGFIDKKNQFEVALPSIKAQLKNGFVLETELICD